MTATIPPAGESKKMIWTGRVISILVVLFLLFDVTGKFMNPPPVAEATAHLGLPATSPSTLGVILLLCVVVYVIPATSILGAILLTGYLGGAVSIHYRAGDPIFTHAIFPVYFGILVWAGVFLRDRRVRALIPFKRKTSE